MSRPVLTLLLAIAAALVAEPKAFGVQAVLWTNNNPDNISFATLDGSSAGDITVSGATLAASKGIAVRRRG